MEQNLQQQFTKLYGKKAEHTFFSPGRVNLIGEHIDYNGGLVMPCAITLGTYMLTAPNNDGLFRFKSVNFTDQLEIPIQNSYQKNGNSWYNYPLGVIHYFVKGGQQLTGLDILYYGDIPIGSGLSSSASIEIVTAFAFNQLFNGGFSKLELVLMAKKVENEFIGLNSGIMDQFAVAFGEENKALMLDCDTLDYEAVDCNLGDYLLAIINTNKPRKLAESKYNERVQECQTALKELQVELDIANLCEMTMGIFDQFKHLITDPTVLNRAEHVVAENDRVKLAAKALAGNDLTEFGRLMYASHHSLQHLYEVSGAELDAVVEYAATDKNVIGARMTGAGFGGCAIALVKKDSLDSFTAALTEYYTAKIGYAPSVYSSHIGNGVGELHPAVAK
jgi:galactokinase